MMYRRKIPEALQQQIRERASYLCEYCHTSELWQYVRFTVDHIVPFSRSGVDEEDNLCLACFHCNRRKSDHITAVDPISGERVSVFHPRQNEWNTHFVWSSDRLYLVGLTAIGRATIHLLDLNKERVIRIRAADLVVGRHPPLSDYIQGAS